MNGTNRAGYFVVVLMVTLLHLFAAACDSKKQTVYKIGILNIVPALEGNIAGFKEGMSELGYREGDNIRYVYHGPTINMSKLAETARKLVQQDKVDLIFSVTTPGTLAAKEATAGRRIPVVFSTVTDPLGAGIVDSIQQPGGNVTGVMFGIQETRRLEWLLRIAPDIKNIYVPYNPNDKSPVLALDIVTDVAEKLGVNLLTFKIRNPAMLDEAVFNIPEAADAVFLLPDSLVSTRLGDLLKTAHSRNLPTSAVNVSAVEDDNVLTAYGSDQNLSGKQAARLVDQILKGARPADLPVELSEFYLAINLKTARVIGLTIPDEILRQTDLIIR